jgi:hypothetical protein
MAQMAKSKQYLDHKVSIVLLLSMNIVFAISVPQAFFFQGHMDS